MGANSTYGELIRIARAANPQFKRDRHPDRACLVELEHQQATYLKEFADDLKDRISEARTLAAKIGTPATLVGVDAAGTPYSLDSGDATGVIVGADTVPYLDTTVLSFDPGADGFVLPGDSIQIVDVYADLTLNYRQPVRWLEAREIAKVTSTFNELYAVVYGYRLVPVKNPHDHKTLWDDVLTVTVVWIPEGPRIDTDDPNVLDTPSVLPVSYSDVLIAELAYFLGRREKTLDPDFPDVILQQLADDTKDTRQTIGGLLAKDHRFIKTRRTTRNR